MLLEKSSRAPPNDSHRQEENKEADSEMEIRLIYEPKPKGMPAQVQGLH